MRRTLTTIARQNLRRQRKRVSAIASGSVPSEVPSAQSLRLLKLLKTGGERGRNRTYNLVIKSDLHLPQVVDSFDLFQRPVVFKAVSEAAIEPEIEPKFGYGPTGCDILGLTFVLPK